MKFFHSFLFVNLIILIGGLGMLYWFDSVEDTVSPIANVDENETSAEPVEEQAEQIDPGSYFVFQKAVIKDSGLSDWANDDVQEYTFYRVKVGETELVPFATVEHRPEFSGSLTSSIFGQNILMHRYQTDAEYDPQTSSPTQGEEQDGLLSLDGEIVVKTNQWATIRSQNGRYEAVFPSGADAAYAQKDTNIIVTDLVANKIVVEFPSSLLIKDTSIKREPEPFLIDDTGTYLYVRDVCGCDGIFSGLLEVNLQTLHVRSLDPLVDLYSWKDASINLTSRQLLAINIEHEPVENSLDYTLLPPTTMSLLDLDSGDIFDILHDQTRALNRPLIDPTGKERYIVHQWGEPAKIFLLGFDDKEITQDHVLTTGLVLGWEGDWIVIQDSSDSSLRLFNIETKESVELKQGENQSLEYIGSLTLNQAGSIGTLETMDPLSQEALGFVVESPEGWGEFSAVLYKRSFPDESGLGEDQEFRGVFSSQSAVIYRATISAIAREGYVGDTAGYLKQSNGQYVVLDVEGVHRDIPQELIVGEIPLANANALLLKGSVQSEEGPSFFPTDPDEFVAVINTPNGSWTGGVFIANMDGQPVVTIEDFQKMLSGVIIK